MRDVSYSLNSLQTGMCYDRLAHPEVASLYTVRMSIRVDIPIDLLLFSASVQTVINRYPVLKSMYYLEKVPFTASVLSSVTVPVYMHDVAALSPAEQQQSIEVITMQAVQEGFDMQKPPLMRFIIFRLGATDTLIVWIRHHILMDGTSAARVVREIFEYYFNPQAVSLTDSGTASVTPWVPPVCPVEADYWKTLLDQHAVCGRLPSPLKTTRSGEHAVLSFCLTPLTCAVIRAFNQRESLSFNTIIVAAWAITLSHYSNHAHVVLGAVRGFFPDDRASEVGVLMNTLPVMVHVNPSTCIADFLQTVRGQLQSLSKCVFTALSDIKHAAGLTAEAPLFDAIVDYKPVSVQSVLKKQFPHVRFEVTMHMASPYALTLECVKEENHVLMQWNYDTGFYTASYLNAIIGHFLFVLFYIVEHPGATLACIPSLPASDYHKIMHVWNDTFRPFPENETLPALFEKIVQRFPDKTAIVFRDATITYAQLNQQVNRVAHYLIQLGLPLETIVGLFLESELDMIVAMLGVIKAGCAYLPLDYEYPAERIAYFLKDSRAPYVIINRHLSLSTEITATVICFEEIPGDGSSFQNPCIPIGPRNLTYVMYTSGTTGKPKGVLIESRSIVNLWMYSCDRFEITHESRFLQLSSFSFDASVMEIFSSLLIGAALFVVERNLKKDIKKLENFIKKNKVTVSIMTPFYLENLDSAVVGLFQTLAIGGEVLGEKNKAYAFHLKISNCYGPTETTVYSTSQLLSPHQPVTIGAPLPCIQVYILSDDQQLLPIGVIGEIYIGGAGVARGYLYREKETQEKFVTVCFADQVPQRVYRSGDIGRWLPQGEIEFVGRRDDVVKIHGLRIGCHEIEATLLSHNEVLQAVVVPIKHEHVDQIVAFVCSASLRSTSESEIALRQFLYEKLPYYMLPNKIMFIHSFPLTVNGKVDRECLKEQYTLHHLPSRASSLEEIDDQIANILLEVVGKILPERFVNLECNIFDLGLHSLNLMTLRDAIENYFKVNVKMNEFFIYTTLQQLKERILELCV